MTVNERLASLRAFFYEPPSEAAWYGITQALQRWPEGQGRALGVEYVCEHLSRARDPWKARIRWVPASWRGDQVLGLASPYLEVLEVLGETHWEWVLVEPSTFTFGPQAAHEIPLFSGILAHEVSLTRPFILQTTPVTQSLWTLMMGHNPSKHLGEGARPVENVTWYGAVAFCNAISRSEGRETAYTMSAAHERARESFSLGVSWRGLDHGGYRLPTDAEWEYACRAGSSAPPDPRGLEHAAWYNENSGQSTHAVGRKRPNHGGLFDMLGNVSEWCWDRYVHFPPVAKVVDPIDRAADNPPGDNRRTLRGGHYGCGSAVISPALRDGADPDEARPYRGFRCARTLIFSRNHHRGGPR